MMKSEGVRKIAERCMMDENAMLVGCIPYDKKKRPWLRTAPRIHSTTRKIVATQQRWRTVP